MSARAIAAVGAACTVAVGAPYAVTSAAAALGRHDVNGMPFHQVTGDRDAERLGRGEERAAVHVVGNTRDGAPLTSGNASRVSHAFERIENHG
ncbi:hypothetical protein GGQ80_002054 [Sphingomonas jinjuensis]|uniref:Uncharacterized protein n=1 Tax=Sphingomonas jinjuensis TaxID=535907 RepID=A0A840FEI8_9SPHN|nr:hypothetical protein [Sphingomonas jinjuensis]MBB4154144.1 hypothetical protein [Sphingomonas jinjuensis]